MDATDLWEEGEVGRAIALLEALVADRSRLDAIDPQARRRLLVAAGRVSRPIRDEISQRNKVLRKRERAQRRRHDLSLVARTEIVAWQRSSSYEQPSPRPDDSLASGAPEGEPELLKPRRCYICKTAFRRVHFFYHALCPACAKVNYDKRGQTARLDGSVALVTGGRVKIGYRTVLSLLRAGARVLATTRFPHDAAERYAEEPDYADFAGRLQIHGLDLRHTPSVELFARFLDQSCDRLDILINNAAQTVRRPPAFYAHLLAREACPVDALPPRARPLLRAYDALRGGGGALPSPAEAAPLLGLFDPARLSQLPCLPEDRDLAAFPPGSLDADRQQIDRRTMNSWRLKLADVPVPELLEVHLVNAIAPFLLVSRLRGLMLRSEGIAGAARHIVNVSAMEAQFSRNKKTDKHPHTNMAKAALNMLTRTSAVDYARDGIFMNSVDTGWVTDEDPLIHAERKQRVHDFFPPLDAVDGAARILDPVFTCARTGRPIWGLFLKDYRSVEW